eukprot:scaffold5538_cov159-Amphora_coffeaeformis.AAC.13
MASSGFPTTSAFGVGIVRRMRQRPKSGPSTSQLRRASCATVTICSISSYLLSNSWFLPLNASLEKITGCGCGKDEKESTIHSAVQPNAPSSQLLFF